MFSLYKVEIEGFSSTVIDALASVLPIVSRRWRFYDEMIQDRVTGTNYDFDEGILGLNNTLDNLAF